MFAPANTIQLRRLVIDLRPAAGFVQSIVGHVDRDLAVAYRASDGKAEVVVWIAVVKHALCQIVAESQNGLFTDVLLEVERRIGDGSEAEKIVLC